MTVLVAIAAALAPGMPVSMVSAGEMVKLRTWWLRGTLGLGTLWLAVHEPWLACMALWYLLRWDSTKQHPGLITWVAIGTTWFLLRSMPAWAWEWIPMAWLAIAGYHVFVCAWVAWTRPSPYERRALGGLWRTKATQGSPAITAIFFALVAPFCPWWGWSVLAVGLYLTWSWLAFAGVAIGIAVLYPTLALLPIGVLTAVFIAWFVTWRAGIKLFEWTPRGDSFDSVINRLILWAVIGKAWWAGPRLLGHGPYSLEPELRRWSSRCWIELPNGEACQEGLQHLYEYGLLGMVAVVAFGVRMGSGVGWGDPWTAALAAAAAITFGHYPLRQPAIGLVVLTIAAGVLR